MGLKKPVGIFLLAAFLISIPLVVRSPYHMHLVIMSGINAILAMTFVLMLRTGLISLAIAAFWGMGAYASTLLVMKAGLSFWLALPCSVVLVGGVALGLGYVFVRNAGFGFLMLTAVLGMLIVVVFGNLALFGGYSGIDSIPAPDPITLPLVTTIEFGSKVPFYYLMLFLLLLVVAAFSAFYRASTGRAWMAIGLNPRLAESLGVNLFRYRLWAFVIASAAAAVAGSFYAHYITAILPGSFDVFKTIYVHIYAILGGVDFLILGPVIGSVIMTFVPEFLRMTKEIEPIATGILVILMILFLPGGLLSLVGTPSTPDRPGTKIARLGKAIKASFGPLRKR
jgi:branched-chain amino acid transport system permease protein